MNGILMDVTLQWCGNEALCLRGTSYSITAFSNTANTCQWDQLNCIHHWLRLTRYTLHRADIVSDMLEGLSFHFCFIIRNEYSVQKKCFEVTFGTTMANLYSVFIYIFMYFQITNNVNVTSTSQGFQVCQSFSQYSNHYLQMYVSAHLHIMYLFPIDENSSTETFQQGSRK